MDGLSPQQRKSLSPSLVSPSKFGDIKIKIHELEYFKNKKSTGRDEDNLDMVGITRLSFIKYCVKLYKDNVEPMLKKLNRNVANRKMISPESVAKRRANIVMNKETLEKAFKDDVGGNNFLSKLDVLRKRHGV